MRTRTPIGCGGFTKSSRWSFIAHAFNRRPTVREAKSNRCVDVARPVAAVFAEDRDARLNHQSPCCPREITCDRRNEGPTRPRLSRWGRTSEIPDKQTPKIREPDGEAAPVTSQYIIPPRRTGSIHHLVEVRVNDVSADEPVRLGEIREHADTPPAPAATKPPDRNLDVLRSDAGNPSLVVTERNQHPGLPAIGAEFWSRHASVPFFCEIVLGQTLCAYDDLHRDQR